MKKLISTLALLTSVMTYSQVGINTTTPTNDLDVNGGVRVRNLTEGTVQSKSNGDLESVPYKVYAFAVIDKSGTILKQKGVSSVTVLGGGSFRINFTNPMADNDYIILSMGKNRTVTYDTVTNGSVVVNMSSNSGTYDFNIIIIDLI